MTTFLMYLIAKLDDISDSIGILLFISATALAFVTIAFFINLDDMNSCCCSKDSKRFVKIINRLRKTLLKVVIISLIASTFLPTTKQAAFIWVAPQIIENGAVKDTVANIPELTKLGTEYLKQMLKDEINDNKNSTTAGENS